MYYYYYYYYYYKLDNLCYEYLRCWLEMPISGTLDIISLPRRKFGLNIVPISTKYIQCQLTIRNCINYSSNEDLKFIHQETSQGKNVQYDTFNSTREVLKVMRKEKEEHIAPQVPKISSLILLGTLSWYRQRRTGS